MKKLIFRKISKDILVFFTFSTILLGLIVWTLQAINYFDLVVEDGHGIDLYFCKYTPIIPVKRGGEDTITISYSLILVILIIVIIVVSVKGAEKLSDKLD